jgi:putative addiction module antidote
VSSSVLQDFVLARYNKCDYVYGMVVELKLRKVGNSVGLVLPKEALARLNVEEGDVIHLTETTDGGFRVTANNPGFAQKMKVAERLGRRYRHALKELAK